MVICLSVAQFTCHHANAKSRNSIFLYNFVCLQPLVFKYWMKYKVPYKDRVFNSIVKTFFFTGWFWPLGAHVSVFFQM